MCSRLRMEFLASNGASAPSGVKPMQRWVKCPAGLSNRNPFTLKLDWYGQFGFCLVRRIGFGCREHAGAACFEKRFGVQAFEQIQFFGDQPGPSGLVAGP